MNAVAGLLHAVVSAAGTIAAPSVHSPDGTVTIGNVTIDAGAGNGAELSGRINVSGLRPGESGGRATVTGAGDINVNAGDHPGARRTSPATTPA